MFKLLLKFGSQNYSELLKIIDSNINNKHFGTIDKIAILKLLERLCELSNEKSVKSELFVITAQTAFESDSISSIKEKVDIMTLENAAKIIVYMKPVQQVFVKILLLVFCEIEEQNPNEKIYTEAILNMLIIHNK